MHPIDLRLTVDPQLPAVMPDTITYETGATRLDVADPSLYAYNHHGSGFGLADPGALTCFVEDLLSGRPLPLHFATHRVTDVDTLLALTVFLRRDLALAPGLPALVASVDLVHRRGPAMLAHLDTDLCRLLIFLQERFPDKLGKAEQGRRIQAAVGWLAGYLLHRTLPPLPAWPQTVSILDEGTSGFVVAETPHPLVYGWVELFRRGYLRGMVGGPGGQVLVARKSSQVPFSLEQAAVLLGELDGKPWRLEGDWLWSPPGGTTLSYLSRLSVLTRV